MKRFIFLAMFALISLSAKTQDIIVRRVGKLVKGKVIAVTDSYVKYKTSSNSDSPVLSEPISNMYYIRYEDGRLQSFDEEEETHFSYYSSWLKYESGFTKQFDLYTQINGWGAGLMLRKEINPNIGWNIIGISYLSGWNSPEDFGIMNVRLSGVRYHSPSIDSFRFYAELNMGYTYVYLGEIESPLKTVEGNSHCFGFDASVGFQPSPSIAIGYNMNFMRNSNVKELTHWVKVSLMLF